MTKAIHKVPINMRADEDLRNLIDQAAAISSKDRTSFILETMRRESENIILDQRLFKLDEEAFSQLDELISVPISSNPALTKLLSSKSPWEE
ncbi:type II toxin-antitoxin system TacA family antitoxin [Alkalimarinus alittae]|uniref:DUF1778 domain-containing protein n=1 Tax=Alkalimarinus alittae TaxID=2961619 RepID=A0ABY6MX30_9ALTE|nr:DUF1778 domain-containing protein [Alkalimarinus alittae]UZE94379.1 DUF1778 domain-containing protein [Alkalimarinus alittae]